MQPHDMLREAFAEAHRTWSELASLEARVGGGRSRSDAADLLELTRAAEAHQTAIDALVDAAGLEPPGSGESRDTARNPSARAAGISNRESAHEEAEERKRHPALDTSSPPPEDAAGRQGEAPLEDMRDRHTSHKAGSRSMAQKEQESRYPDRPAPSTAKVDGAFGRETQKNREIE
jgi:hypothetical protein